MDALAILQTAGLLAARGLMSYFICFP